MRQGRAIKLYQGRIGRIALRYDGIFDWPANADLWIVPGNSAFIGAVVEAAYFVVEVGDLAEHAKAVCKTRRHIDLTSRPVVAQFGTEPSSECRRRLAQIDDRVEDLSAYDRDYLRLRMLYREMQAAQHALRRPRMIILYEFLDDFPPRDSAATESSPEKSRARHQSNAAR